MSAAAAQALKVDELVVSYDSVVAVHGINFEVGQREAVAVIGSNGAGKTSTLRGIMRLVRSRVGAIDLFGKSMLTLKAHEMSRVGVGYVPEGRELFRGFTVEEELQLGGRRLPRADREAKMAEMFALFPRLKERRGQITRTLSGGEQQMCAIGRTLMTNPRILFLDEPSLGLAPVMQDVVYETLEQLREKGLPMLLVEQNAFRALKLCARAYVLELGRITRAASSVELLDDPAIRSAYLGK
jgi:branched-chain amino acid transport system ATP-binding protein